MTNVAAAEIAETTDTMPSVFERLAGLTGEITLSRQDLEEIFPHRGPALIADHAIINPIECQLHLPGEQFGEYLAGQPWNFPPHFQQAMLAQVAGLAAMVKLAKQIGPEKLSQYKFPIIQRSGDWETGPLMTNLVSKKTLIASACYGHVRLEIINSKVAYEASAKIAHGHSHAFYGGIRVILAPTAD